jgi:hypothetical protein
LILFSPGALFKCLMNGPKMVPASPVITGITLSLHSS